jgi:hypothetical protein
VVRFSDPTSDNKPKQPKTSCRQAIHTPFTVITTANARIIIHLNTRNF